jgi:DNA repair protein RadA/Sms
MVKLRVVHRCSGCGAESPQWAGRCPACGEWNTLAEAVGAADAVGPSGAVAPGQAPRPVTDIDPSEGVASPTGIDELDRVLGGGLVPGSVTLLGGEPGVGKSTLLLMVAAATASRSPVLYVSAEERAQQVRSRAERLHVLHPGLWLLAETSLPRILAACDQVQPGLVVIDSIQTVHDPDLPSAPGSVVQVRGCAHRLVQEAKCSGRSVVLAGHVTKEGNLAGPRVLEHVVDTVLAFEADGHHALRLLRATKHRFGATGDLGLFEMGERGLAPVADPSALLLADRRADTEGSAVVAAIDGHRPLLVEVQALVNPSTLTFPRRSTQGIDANRLEMLLAVLQSRCSIDIGRSDVFVSTVGGVRVGEPGLDLGICLALVSAASRTPLPADVAACGEVGLGGELRQVAQSPRRLAEVARLGFRKAIVPRSAPGPGTAADGLEVRRVATLGEALVAAGLRRSGGNGHRPQVIDSAMATSASRPSSASSR